MATRFKTLKEYLYPDSGKKTFVIPCYQRGYKWSVRLAEEQTSVEYLINSLLKGYENRRNQQFFLQGVTVAEDGDKIILVDGQQRTTTLYLLLRCLGIEYVTGEKDISLDYSVRKQSKEYINNLKKSDFDFNSTDKENKIQDIFYFKQAIAQINDVLSKEKLDKEDFVRFLLDKVCLLYIVIDHSKAIRIFTMMNGQKARMHDEELIKAEILHIVSLPEERRNQSIHMTIEAAFSIIKEVAATEWETNALRSKYAREWDKWLYWWNRKDVKEFFNIHKPMGLLLEYYFRKKTGCANFSFRIFKERLLPDNGTKAVKGVFKELRDLQKKFEDVYNNPKSYNYLKCSLIASNGEAEDRNNIIKFFLENKKDTDKLREYAKWRLLGATHIEVTEEYTNDPTVDGGRVSNKEKREEKAKKMIRDLSQSHVYNVYDDMLFRQLLRLNVEEYNKLNDGHGVKFDFSIWSNKSLEHIYPKSKFYHMEKTEEGETAYVRGDGKRIRQDEAMKLINSNAYFSDSSKYSEHCIGNLVLLYGRNNSEFGNLPFERKKELFFNNERSFESRNLLHTIASFASSEWGAEGIEKAAKETLRILSTDYNIEYHD